MFYCKRMVIRAKETSGLAILTFMSCFAVSCSTSTVQVVETEERQRMLEFLEIGLTSKKEVFDRLGAPSSEFPADQVIIYWLCGQRTQGGEQIRLGKNCMNQQYGFPLFNLVLSFKNETLERQSLIRVR